MSIIKEKTTIINNQTVDEIDKNTIQVWMSRNGRMRKYLKDKYGQSKTNNTR